MPKWLPVEPVCDLVVCSVREFFAHSVDFRADPREDVDFVFLVEGCHDGVEVKMRNNYMVWKRSDNQGCSIALDRCPLSALARPLSLWNVDPGCLCVS